MLAPAVVIALAAASVAVAVVDDIKQGRLVVVEVADEAAL